MRPHSEFWCHLLIIHAERREALRVNEPLERTNIAQQRKIKRLSEEKHVRSSTRHPRCHL